MPTSRWESIRRQEADGRGLPCLLVTETEIQGFSQVTVQAPGFAHYPPCNRGVVEDINARVNYARSVAAAAQEIGPGL